MSEEKEEDPRQKKVQLVYIPKNDCESSFEVGPLYGYKNRFKPPQQPLDYSSSEVEPPRSEFQSDFKSENEDARTVPAKLAMLKLSSIGSRITEERETENISYTPGPSPRPLLQIEEEKPENEK